MEKRQSLLECSSTLCKNMEVDMDFLQAIEGSLSWIVFVVGMRVIMAKEI